MVAVLIPPIVRPLTDDEQRVRLKAQRAATLKRIDAAIQQQRFWALRSTDEYTAWKASENSLRFDLEMIDGDLKHFNTPRDERYAAIREQMKYDDANCVGASDGSVDWENT